MRNKIAAAKQTIKENKFGIAVVGSITIVYGSMLGASYIDFKTSQNQLETVRVHNDTSRIENL